MRFSHFICGWILFLGMVSLNPAQAEILAPSQVEAGTAFELTWGSDTSVSHVLGNGTTYQEADRPVTVSLSSPGDYTFTERFCFYYFGWQCAVYDTHVVHVTAAPGVRPDQLSTQIQYDYEVRTGDFDNNGYLDVLIDRLTPGQVDGSLQSVILSQTAGGLTAEVPSAGELSHARTFAIDPSITLEAVDMNVDAFGDLAVSGLQSIGSSLEDRHVLFAPGEIGVAEPLGLSPVDDDFVSFFGELMEWAGNPSFFTEQLVATISPVFGFSFDCSQDFNYVPLMCLPVPTVVGYQVVSSGSGYNPDAFTASVRTEALHATGHANGFNNTWWELSQAFEGAIGVHAFGFRDDGSRVSTNHHMSVLDNPAEEAALVFQDWLTLLFYWNLTRQPPPNVPLNDWVAHHYVVVSEICDTSESWCTLDNIYCWSRRQPAPRADDSIDIVDDGDDNTLDYGNPIVTWVDEAGHGYVNETQEGHVFHDDAQAVGCGNLSPIPARCSTVERWVVQDGTKIVHHTRGTGYNPNATYKVVNEVGGVRIFKNLDRLIAERAREYGSCVLY